MPHGTWAVAFQLVSGARADPALAAIIRDNYADFRNNLCALIERGQAQGKIRTDFPADLLGDQLCALADGWMMMTPIDPTRYDNEGRRSTLVELALAMMKPPASREKKSLYAGLAPPSAARRNSRETGNR